MTTAGTPNDPLAELKDIHLPAEIAWWPLAPGWWALLFILVASIAIAYAFYHFVIRKKAYRKAALRELDQLNAAMLQPEAYIESVAAIIRRTAICTEKLYAKTSGIAKLQGIAWQEYLQLAMPAEQARIIAISRYQPVQQLDTDALHSAAQQWIKRHKP